MGYQFKGFFTSCSDEQKEKIIESANKKWPEIKYKTIYEPFSGVGVCMPNLAEEIPDDLLPSWSTQFPSNTFVYIEADCFGGTCLYNGYVCKNNEIIIETKTSDKDSLEKLLLPLGVKLNKNNYFKPLEREYFN